LPTSSPWVVPLTPSIFPPLPPLLPPLLPSSAQPWLCAGAARARLRWCRRSILGLCGLLSALALAAAAAAGCHPLELLAALLPLQVACLLWLVTRFV
jgi:hypothetical protein